MTESEELQKVTNHPAHIVDNGQLSPTALIPFCEFGGNMSVMGVNIDQLDVPVCNSFRPKIFRDQLCYEVDPNEYKDKINLKGELSFSLFIDYNEDRIQGNVEDSSLEPFITMNTIGNRILSFNKFKITLKFFQSL